MAAQDQLHGLVSYMAAMFSMGSWKNYDASLDISVQKSRSSCSLTSLFQEHIGYKVTILPYFKPGCVKISSIVERS